MSLSANGAKFYIDGTELENLDTIGAKKGGSPIPITCLADLAHLIEAGLEDLEITLNGAGVPTVAEDAEGSIEYVAPGGTQGTNADDYVWFVSEWTVETGTDQKIRYTVSMAPSPDAVV